MLTFVREGWLACSIEAQNTAPKWVIDPLAGCKSDCRDMQTNRGQRT